jgi:hypothetical protein
MSRKEKTPTPRQRRKHHAHILKLAARAGQDPLSYLLKRVYAAFSARAFPMVTPLLLAFAWHPRSPARSARREHLQPEGWAARRAAAKRSRKPLRATTGQTMRWGTVSP